MTIQEKISQDMNERQVCFQKTMEVARNDIQTKRQNDKRKKMYEKLSSVDTTKETTIKAEDTHQVTQHSSLPDILPIKEWYSLNNEDTL